MGSSRELFRKDRIKFIEGTRATVESVKGVAADKSPEAFGLSWFRTIALFLFG